MIEPLGLDPFLMYRILDRTTVPEYLCSIPAVAEKLGSPEGLEVQEIGNGNLNFVYRVCRRDDPSNSVILKQAVPYLRMVGEEWPLGRDRMTFEIRALQQYNDLVPAYVPTIFHADEKMSTLVMQCLDRHEILRQGLIEGRRFPNVGRHIGEFLAETLFRTSSLAMDSQARRALMNQFTLNAELCKLTEEFIFTFPYMEHESNYSNPVTDQWARENLRNHAAYKLGIMKFKELFLTKTDALLHADLHTGSLMVNADETYIIDMEFAYFGPFGFDVGKIMANFFMCATSHLHRTADAAYVNWLLEQAYVIWQTFATRFRQLWDATASSAMMMPGMLSPQEEAAFKDRTMRQVLHDTVGFAACSIARRTLGIAGVADIRGLPDLDKRAELEILNLKLSMQLMAAHESVDSIDDLTRLVRDFYAPHLSSSRG